MPSALLFFRALRIGGFGYTRALRIGGFGYTRALRIGGVGSSRALRIGGIGSSRALRYGAKKRPARKSLSPPDADNFKDSKHNGEGPRRAR